MTASYPITEARGQLGELARRAAQHERVVLTDRGQPTAVLISPAELEDMEDALAVARLERDRALGVQQRLSRTPMPAPCSGRAPSAVPPVSWTVTWEPSAVNATVRFPGGAPRHTG